MSQATAQAEERRIRELINCLPDEQRLAIYTEIEKQIKDPDTYAALNFLFIAGLHHFYLGKWRRGLINLAIFWVGLAILIIDVFGIYVPMMDWSRLLLSLSSWQLGLGLLVGISILELYELFRSQGIVQDYNNQVMAAIYQETV